VIRFCELRGYPCYVIHNNVKIEEYYPPGYDTWDTHKKAETPRIMFCVWNGHALFYNREAANALAHMHKGKPMYDKPFMLLKHPSQSFKQLTFDEMQPYSIALLDKAYEDRQTCTLYVLTAADLKRVETDIKLRGYAATPRMQRRLDRQLIQPSTWPKARIRIRQLPADVEKLSAIAKAFEKAYRPGTALPRRHATSLMRRLVDRAPVLPPQVGYRKRRSIA
jgi:hypothetical protein